MANGIPPVDESITAAIGKKIGVYYATIVRTISIKLPDDLLARLESEAKARRVTRSLLIRESLLRKESRAGEPSCYDLARDLAGVVKGLPRNLVEDPKYMEGFGQ
jgi:predicted DNA-binding protein